ALGVAEIGIGQIAGERCIVVTNRRGEENGARTVEEDVEMRKMAGVAMIKTVRASRSRKDVAIGIEHGKGIAMLQVARATFLERRRGGDLELLRRRDGRLKPGAYVLRRLSHGQSYGAYRSRAISKAIGSPLRIRGSSSLLSPARRL